MILKSHKSYKLLNQVIFTNILKMNLFIEIYRVIILTGLLITSLIIKVIILFEPGRMFHLKN